MKKPLLLPLFLCLFFYFGAAQNELQPWPDVVRNWDGATSEFLNANGLGKCYDIRRIDPSNLAQPTIIAANKERSAVKLFIDPQTVNIPGLNRNYMAPAGVSYTALNGATSQHSCEVIATRYDFESKVMNNVSASVSGGGKKVGGSASYSKLWGSTVNESTGNETVNMYSTMTKTFYKLTLKTDGSYTHVMDDAFTEYVERLGVDISPEGFIYMFGTHYAGAATYGGTFISSTTVNKSTYQYSKLNTDQWQAEASASYKGVTATVGGGQSTDQMSSEFRQQMNSNHRTYSVGGEQNTRTIDQWAPTVANKLSVIGVDLVPLSDLLTPKNFPHIPDISAKQNLLRQAIDRAEREADENKAAPESVNFFQKTPVTFTVTAVRLGGGSTDDNGSHNELEVYGTLTMGLYQSSGIPISKKQIFNQSSGSPVIAGNAAWHTFYNQTVSATVPAEHVNTGYASVYGNLMDKDDGGGGIFDAFDADEKFQAVNKGQYKIPFANLINPNQEEQKEASFTCEDNQGTIKLEFKLKRTEPSGSASAAKAKPGEYELKAAAEANNMNQLRELVVEKGGSIQNVNGILSTAITTKNINSLNTLMDYGAQTTQADLDNVFNNYYDTKMAIALIERGAVPNSAHFQKAMSMNDEKVIIACLNNGISAQVGDLRSMISQDKYNVVKVMLDKSSYMQLSSDVLNYAIGKKDKELTKKMVAVGGNQIVQPKNLVSAANTRDTAIINYILPLTPASHEALQVTADMNDATKFKYFIDKGARLTDNAPLNKAVDNNNFDILKMSLDNGGDASQAVSYSVSKNNLKAISMSLASGGDPQPVIKYSIDQNNRQLYDTILYTYNANADSALRYSIHTKKYDYAASAIRTGRPNSSAQLASTVPLGLNWVQLLVEEGNADPNMAMVRAVDLTKNDILSYLIGKGGNATPPELIVRGVERQNLQTVKILVEEGNATPENGRVKAIDLDNLEITEYLLKMGATATGMDVPAGRGKLPMVKLLHSFGCDVNKGAMPAVKGNHTDVAIYLLDNEAKIDGLMAATAEHGNVTVGQKLLDRGADPNDGVKIAVERDHTELSILLLDNNASIEGLIAIAAGTNGNIHITENLLKKGADPEEAIKGAVQRKFVEVAALLIEYGADVSSSDYMLIAVGNNDARMADLLFASGTDVTYTDANGNNFLHMTADDDGRIEIVRSILKFGLDIDAVNNQKHTALHLAAMSGKDNLMVARAILDAGACPNPLDNEEKTPPKVAKSKKMRDLLSEYGGVSKTKKIEDGCSADFEGTKNDED